MQTIYKHRNKIILFLIILLSIPFIFNIGLDTDEPFTLGLVKHSYIDVINLTKLDVHPPLYYLVLKSFLQITTFWTNIIFIKIIFARLLSVIFSVITLTYLFKLLSSFNIQINKYVGSLIFILMPFGLGKFYQITNIRMYAMCIMLMTMEIFYVNKLQESSKIKDIIFLILIVSSSLYSNYFAGLTSGLYIILFLLYNVYRKKVKAVISFILVGFISLLSFLPWISTLLIQSTGSNETLMEFFQIKNLLRVIIFTVFLMLLIILRESNKKLITTTIISSITLLITNTVINIISFPNQRYFSFLIVPLLFIFSAISINNFKLNNTLVNKIILILLAMFLAFRYFPSVYNMLVHFNFPSISFVKKFNNIKKIKSGSINTHAQKITDYRWNNGAGSGGNAIYLLSINKKINDKNYISTYQIVGNGNEKLFKSIFPNIEHYSTKKPN